MNRLYTDVAPWWPLLSPPEDYAHEAELYLALLQPTASLLELGSGGGHLASHFPPDLDVVLVDLAPEMLAASRKLNPDRDHREADLRTLRLDRTFDAVLLHDAVMYMLTEEDLRAAYATAFAHLREGGRFGVLPDLTRESWSESTVGGGSSGPDRAARMLEWRWDPDPSDTTFRVDMVYLLRHPDGRVESIHDPHTMGIFSRADHVRILREVGFVMVEPDPLLAVECGELFLARKP